MGGTSQLTRRSNPTQTYSLLPNQAPNTLGNETRALFIFMIGKPVESELNAKKVSYYTRNLAVHTPNRPRLLIYTLVICPFDFCPRNPPSIQKNVVRVTETEYIQSYVFHARVFQGQFPTFDRTQHASTRTDFAKILHKQTTNTSLETYQI